MIQTEAYQKNWEGVNFENPTNGILVFHVLGGGTLKTIRLKLGEAVADDVEFQIIWEGTDIGHITIPAGAKTGISSTFDIEVAIFQQIELNLVSVPSGVIVKAPIVMQLNIDEILLSRFIHVRTIVQDFDIDIPTYLNDGVSSNGLTFADDDVVLVVNQVANPEQNGPWIVADIPIRHPKFTTFNSIPGTFFKSLAGTNDSNSTWICTSPIGGVLDVDALDFEIVCGRIGAQRSVDEAVWLRSPDGLNVKGSDVGFLTSNFRRVRFGGYLSALRNVNFVFGDEDRTLEFPANGVHSGTNTGDVNKRESRIVPLNAATGSFTSGLLEKYIVYEMNTCDSRDDFSNVAEVISGTINSPGCIFIATGTTPTNWSHGSEIASYQPVYAYGLIAITGIIPVGVRRFVKRVTLSNTSRSLESMGGTGAWVGWNTDGDCNNLFGTDMRRHFATNVLNLLTVPEKALSRSTSTSRETDVGSFLENSIFVVGLEGQFLGMVITDNSVDGTIDVDVEYYDVPV